MFSIYRLTCTRSFLSLSLDFKLAFIYLKIKKKKKTTETKWNNVREGLSAMCDRSSRQCGASASENRTFAQIAVVSASQDKNVSRAANL